MDEVVTPTPAEIAEVLRLHGLWLSGESGGKRANLSRANLSRANLSRANLDGANLSRANLDGANLYGANLYGANLSRANLDGASLYGANLDGANLSRANLDGANLDGANLYGANLSRANLDGASLYGANLDGANLYGANLYGANLSRANLDGASLYGANLDGANLDGANLDGANLDGATLPTGEVWAEYLSRVLPALLAAGGKTVEEVMAAGAWECHGWTNCPMATAFGVNRESKTPPLLRPRVRQFVQFFDAGLIVAARQPDGTWGFGPAPYTPPADADWASKAESPGEAGPKPAGG